jgi:hypothetical protein
MTERVKPFAHDLSLSPLDGDLILGKGSEKDKQRYGVESSPVGPYLWDSCAHGIGEIVLLNIEQASSS